MTKTDFARSALTAVLTLLTSAALVGAAVAPAQPGAARAVVAAARLTA